MSLKIGKKDKPLFAAFSCAVSKSESVNDAAIGILGKDLWSPALLFDRYA